MKRILILLVCGATLSCAQTATYHTVKIVPTAPGTPGGATAGQITIQNAGQTTTSSFGDASITLSEVASSVRPITIDTSGCQRWETGVDGIPEAGGNQGSNFFIQRWSDTCNSAIDAPIYIDRNTGIVDMIDGFTASAPVISPKTGSFSTSGQFWQISQTGSGTALSVNADVGTALNAGATTGTAVSGNSSSTGAGISGGNAQVGGGATGYGGIFSSQRGYGVYASVSNTAGIGLYAGGVDGGGAGLAADLYGNVLFDHAIHVSALPACTGGTTGTLGVRREVSDATVATPGSAAVGGGTYTIAVQCIFNSSGSVFTWIID